MNYANKLTGLNLKRSFEALVQLTEGARIPDGIRGRPRNPEVIRR